MRVAINCRSFLKKQCTGIGRYAYHLVKSLSVLDRDNTYLLYARKGMFSFNKRLPAFPSKNFIPRIDWFNRGPARLLRDSDIYHCPSPSSLEAPKKSKIIVTVHDVICKAFPEGHTPDTLKEGEKQFAMIRQKADKIICCSQNTVNDVRKYFDIPESKITLVYQGADKNMFYRIGPDEEALAQGVLRKRAIVCPYILAVGTIEPRKNLSNLMRAFSILREKKVFDGKLVIAGMEGWMHNDLGVLIGQLGLKNHIVFTGYLPDSELRVLYNKAEVFVFPSLYEGFGYPIVEAFCCGAPVVTSNVSSCPEIAGDAALTVNPRNPEEIARAVEKVLTNRDLRETLRSKGLQRAQAFDFDKTALETLAVYREVYNNGKL